MRRSIYCSVCQASTFYHTKGKCIPCYDREKRQKPEYKERQRRYAEKHWERIREYQRRYREKYRNAPRNARKPLKRSTPLPRPTKRLRPVSASPRRREIRRKDREFQASIPENACCAVGKGCVGQLVKHHLRRRRYLASRWDDKNAMILCFWHHQVLHQLGENRFLEKYPWVKA
jgi:hypothetical protein